VLIGFFDFLGLPVGAFFGREAEGFEILQDGIHQETRTSVLPRLLRQPKAMEMAQRIRSLAWRLDSMTIGMNPMKLVMLVGMIA
jgi:hypothetical protein